MGNSQGASVPTREPELEYALTVNSSPESGVSISSSTQHGGTTGYTKAVPKGTTVTLTAPQFLTAPQYVGTGASQGSFIGWTGSVNDTSRTISFSMDSGKTVTAEYGYILTFLGWEVTISSSTGHGGTVPYSLTVPPGTTVTITAPDTLMFPNGPHPCGGWWISDEDGRDTIFSTGTTTTFAVNRDMILGTYYGSP